MDIGQKALYNSLRMSWTQDPHIHVETWQVEDYRHSSAEALLDRLRYKGLHLDRMHFTALSEQVDNPEELTDCLIGEEEISHEEYDQIYLLIFELWRRFVPEKMSLSILCDELDYQIFQYDEHQIDDLEPINNALNNLSQFLDNSMEEGINPQELLRNISELCANNLESFLYDFIVDRLDEGDEENSQELIERFYPYTSEKKWFHLLRARCQYFSQPEKAHLMMENLYQEEMGRFDVPFNLDILTGLLPGGQSSLFRKIVKETLDHINNRDDYIDLLNLCSEFFGRLDQDDRQKKIDELITSYTVEGPQEPFFPRWEDVILLKTVLGL